MLLKAKLYLSFLDIGFLVQANIRFMDPKPPSSYWYMHSSKSIFQKFLADLSPLLLKLHVANDVSPT